MRHLAHVASDINTHVSHLAENGTDVTHTRHSGDTEASGTLSV